MGNGSPLRWTILELKATYWAPVLSQVEVALDSLDRIDSHRADLPAFVAGTRKLLLEQVALGEAEYRQSTSRSLLGIPVSIKYLFGLSRVVTTYGFLVYREHVAKRDSIAVLRQRAGRAMFTGKTTAAEFGQSTTTASWFGLDVTNL